MINFLKLFFVIGLCPSGLTSLIFDLSTFKARVGCPVTEAMFEGLGIAPTQGYNRTIHYLEGIYGYTTDMDDSYTISTSFERKNQTSGEYTQIPYISNAQLAQSVFYEKILDQYLRPLAPNTDRKAFDGKTSKRGMYVVLPPYGVDSLCVDSELEPAGYRVGIMHYDPDNQSVGGWETVFEAYDC